MDFIFKVYIVKYAPKDLGIACTIKAEKQPGVELERLWSVCTEPQESSDLAGRVAHC